MGNKGETRILTKGDNGWQYGDEITGFDGRIYSSLSLSDTEVLVMGGKGETRILTIPEKNIETLKRNLDKIK